MSSTLKLLTMPKAQPKGVKGEKEGYMTFILHLAPADLSGYRVCAASSAGCRAACLNLAGRGGMFKAGETTNSIQRARIRKTKWFFEDRESFMVQLGIDIGKAITMANKKDLIPVFRLNGTSDIPWEKIRYLDYRNIMSAFFMVQFYDYTKIRGRSVPHNYHLTFSRSEDNDREWQQAYLEGMNVAIVYNIKKSKPLPVLQYFNVASASTVAIAPIFNGDESDLRFLDPQYHIIGLYAKGKAKKDTTGFVMAA
jgi:hypothetical protein